MTPNGTMGRVQTNAGGGGAAATAGGSAPDPGGGDEAARKAKDAQMRSDQELRDMIYKNNAERAKQIGDEYAPRIDAALKEVEAAKDRLAQLQKQVNLDAIPPQIDIDTINQLRAAQDTVQDGVSGALVIGGVVFSGGTAAVLGVVAGAANTALRPGPGAVDVAAGGATDSIGSAADAVAAQGGTSRIPGSVLGLASFGKDALEGATPFEFPGGISDPADVQALRDAYANDDAKSLFESWFGPGDELDAKLAKWQESLENVEAAEADVAEAEANVQKLKDAEGAAVNAAMVRVSF